jgi:hypothetical protein
MNPENMQPNETVEFLWRRMTQECPEWAIFVPVLFGFLVVGLIVMFREERKLFAAIVGGSVVGVISLVYLPLAFLLLKAFSWLVILVPVMGVALFYVGLMYLRDARSVHWLWAFFLGSLRCTVYVTLALVFLLPSCQYSEKKEYKSQVVFLFDVSGSMFTVDDLPVEGQDRKLLPTRQDKIVHFLTANQDERGRDVVPFMDRVLAKTPVTAYRFGPVLDEGDILNLEFDKEKSLAAASWKKWLVPDRKDVPAPDLDKIKDEDAKKEKLNLHAKRLDLVDTLRSGTNVGAAALQAHKLENNSFVQAIIIVSDGQSNVGSDDARTEFLQRVSNPKRRIPVITVGVGQFRLPASIRIDDIQAPEETRPDDKFPVRVPVVGTGLADEPFTVTLEITRVKDVTGKPVEEKTYQLEPKQGKFKGAGDHPQDLVEFEIDVQDLKKIKAQDDKNADLEGEWHLRARVPRNPKEAFAEKEHVTDPIKVQIQKRALRVLLFAGGATREYQFLRTILYRETNEKRMEFSVYLQSGKEDHIDQDVPAERLLNDFPNTIGPNNPGEQFMSLSDYDVVVAFDPDWSKLSSLQLRNLKEWVGTHAGGVIFVAGPIFSYQIARPGGNDFSALTSIYPVYLKDNRLHGLGLSGAGLGHDTSRPYALNFSPAAANFDFLKLDESGEGPTAGWGAFFWNNEKFVPEPGKDYRPKRGFYTFYPVDKLKAGANVAAAFAGPKESRIGDKTDAFKDQQPFIVTMPFGAGKTLYLGSGEFWRLRAFKDGYHDRIWIKMARHVAAGATQQKKYGRILMPRTIPVGVVSFEAQVKGKDLRPLPTDIRPTVLVRRIDKDKEEKETLQKFDLQAKPTDADWQGYFIGQHTIKEPGEYEFQLPIPGTTESLRQNLIVRKPNPELDNVRTNFGYLYSMASTLDALKSLPADKRKEIERLLQSPTEGAVSDETKKRLFFPLSSAGAIADCLVQVPPRQETVKGRLEDLWDVGMETDRVINAFLATVLAPLLVGLIGVIILAILRQWMAALTFFGICVVASLLIAGLDYMFRHFMSEDLPLHFSYLMMIVVSLLGIEWLARKLLRLA